MKKEIMSKEFGGVINIGKFSSNSITFEGATTLKANAIRLVGTLDINGNKLVNPYIEDIDGAIVTYHKKRHIDGITDLATVYFLNEIPAELLYEIQNYLMQDFVVEFDEPCPCCGG